MKIKILYLKYKIYDVYLKLKGERVNEEIKNK